jgi:hypothetical protein
LGLLIIALLFVLALLLGLFMGSSQFLGWAVTSIIP